MKPASASESEIFSKFISTRKILIADESSSARSGIFNVFSALGVKPFQITLASSLNDAQNEIKRICPDVVIAEFNFGRHCGLELLQRQRETNPDSKKSVFLLLTSNTSQTAVARAAEEDVDGFILKPFTPEVFRKKVIQAAMLKSHPPEYLLKIEKGKELLMKKAFNEAEKVFQEAQALDSQPALACYYLGQTEFLKKVMESAKQSYQHGLEFNKIHYKCLVGLFELLMDLKMHQESYDVVKKISQYFPANPKRLVEVLRLAILTNSYEDIEKYYSIFCSIDDRDDQLVNYICAAMVVTGKHYLRSNNRARGLELLRKALATSAGRVRFHKEIVQTLIDAKLAVDAKKFMERYPPEARSSTDYLMLEFQILNLSASPAGILNQGLALLSKGIESEKLFEILLSRAIETENARVCENILNSCLTKFPSLHARFLPSYESLAKRGQATQEEENQHK